MKLTARIKLLPDQNQFSALKLTLETANAACNYASDVAWESKVFRQFDLHKLTYAAIREQFSLTAQLAIRVISKVSDAYKVDKDTKRVFRKLGAVAFDERILSFKLSKSEVSIWAIGGRQKISFVCGKRDMELLAGDRGQSDLCFICSTFYLFVSCEVETPEPLDVEGILGVDMGIVSLASDSDGESFSGAAVESNRRKYAHRRCNLQRKQTKSARRKLRKISGRQARYQKDTNHVISKRIVQKAQDTNRAIAIESLGGIRERVTVGRRQRAKHANWAFYQLRQFITYKAELAGVPVVPVDPRNTSRTCPKCGCVDKKNRPDQSTFLCVSCGHSANADTNAAVNIAARAAVSQPMVSDHKGLGTSPRL